MVLTFTGQLVPKMSSLVQDKNWFFNGIDIYRTMSSINVFADQDKNWFFNGIDLYRNTFSLKNQFRLQKKWFFKSIEFNRSGGCFEGYCDLYVELLYSS